MSNAPDLKSLMDKAKERGGRARFTIYFTGGREQEFYADEWTFKDATGLPNNEYRIWVIDKNDGSEQIVVNFFNVTLYRFEA